MRRTAISRIGLHSCSLAAACAMLLGTSHGALGRVLESADIAKIVELEQPAISPDGRRVVFVAIAATPSRDAYENRLLVVDVATRVSRTLVTGHAVSDPRWSSDGTQLGYVATAGAAARAQVFVRDAAGHVRQITHAPRDVVDFAWRPDGRAIAFAAYDASAAAAGRVAQHYFEAGDNDYTATAALPALHLWLAPAMGGPARRLTSGIWTVAPTDRGGLFTAQFAWSASGNDITFTRLAHTAPGDDEESTLQRLAASSGRTRTLTRHRKLELSAQPAPRGTRVAYWYPRDGDFLSQNELHVLSGASDANLTRRLDRNVAGSLWMPDGKSLLVCADDGARVRAWFVSLTKTLRPLALGDRDIVCDPYSSSTFDAGIAASVARTGSIAFLASDARTPRELYVLASPSAPVRRLTNLNGFVAGIALGTMTPFAWRGPAGRESGVVTYPPHRIAAKRYPIVVLVHGGPGLSSAADFAWTNWPLAQLIAAHGYIVFQPNYRGSDGDGNAYMHAIYRDTVEGPARDILSGLSALERLPSTDAARVAVCGWSYGGLLTSWLTVRRHDWRAAVSGAAVNDEAGEYDLSVSNVQNRYYFGTSPYAAGGMALYRSQSPLEFARRITTPTLIWGTTGDPVVPITMSYALYHALKDNHVPVKFVVFASQTHGPSTARDTEDLTDLWLDWLDRYLR